MSSSQKGLDQFDQLYLRYIQEMVKQHPIPKKLERQLIRHIRPKPTA